MKKLNTQRKKLQQKAVKTFRKNPVISMLVVFIVFVVLVVASLLLQQKPEVVAEQEETPFEVTAVRFGDGDVSEDVLGTIENKSTLTLVAQSSGPVTTIEAAEGDQVWRGTVLVRQETAYAAGNAATVQRQVAQQNYTLADETLKNTVQSVAKTREQADKNRTNTEELRKISEQSISETEGFISRLETQYDELEGLVDAEPAGSGRATLRSSLISTQNFLNQSRSSLRSLQYDTNTDNPPTNLADLQKDLIYLSTEIQLKSAEIQKNIAGLNVQAAKISEAATRVASPIEGTVQRILVNEGEYVTPGTPVAVVTGEKQLQVSINVSGAIANRVDVEQPAYITLGDQSISLPVTHVSSAPVAGQLFEVLVAIPEGYAEQVFEQQTVEVTLPLYSVSLVGGNYHLPLDSVFITNTDTFVYVEEDNRAVKKSVELGEISGSMVEIKNGLVPGDVVILNRSVIEDQLVEVEIQSSQKVFIEELG